MYFTEEDQKVCEEYMKHYQIKIFENSAYADQHSCLNFLRSSLQPFHMLMNVNTYFRKKHHILMTKVHKSCHVFEVWQELSRFMNFVEELRYLDYAIKTSKHLMTEEAFKWFKPFVHLVMIHSAKASITEEELKDNDKEIKHDHSECFAKAQSQYQNDHDV